MSRQAMFVVSASGQLCEVSSSEVRLYLALAGCSRSSGPDHFGCEQITLPFFGCEQITLPHPGVNISRSQVFFGCEHITLPLPGVNISLSQACCRQRVAVVCCDCCLRDVPLSRRAWEGRLPVLWGWSPRQLLRDGRPVLTRWSRLQCLPFV